MAFSSDVKFTPVEGREVVDKGFGVGVGVYVGVGRGFLVGMGVSIGVGDATGVGEARGEVKGSLLDCSL
jgi:hypothetical protein